MPSRTTGIGLLLLLLLLLLLQAVVLARVAKKGLRCGLVHELGTEPPLSSPNTPKKMAPATQPNAVMSSGPGSL